MRGLGESPSRSVRSQYCNANSTGLMMRLRQIRARYFDDLPSFDKIKSTRGRQFLIQIKLNEYFISFVTLLKENRPIENIEKTSLILLIYIV